MAGVKYDQVKKDFPQKAKEILQEQETLVLFLNSPVKKNWMTILKLDDKEQSRVSQVVEHYAKLKIQQENKLKPKSKEDVIEIENKVLRQVYEARLLKIRNVKGKLEAMEVAKKLAKEKFPQGVVFGTHQMDKLTTLAGADSARITPVDIIVFDPESKKIVSFEVVTG